MGGMPSLGGPPEIISAKSMVQFEKSVFGQLCVRKRGALQLSRAMDAVFVSVMARAVVKSAKQRISDANTPLVKMR